MQIIVIVLITFDAVAAIWKRDTKVLTEKKLRYNRSPKKAIKNGLA
jgi:hypothetical protein